MDTARPRACLITPPGEGGIGIISLAGPGAAQVLDAVFVGTRRTASSLPEGALAHGTIRGGGGVVDEVIVARVGETFEVNCHGGIAATRAVLACLEAAGAQVVGPAERARAPAGPPLLQERIRGRALELLPDAPTRLAAAILLHQAGGALTRGLDAVADALSAGDAAGAGRLLDGLLRTAPLGRALLRPPRVALLGPPNAGKSTLMNALLEEERVIVRPEPGTTRDVVSETLSVRGVPFEVLDAAGIRVAEDEVERLAVERAAALAGACEVALLVYDAAEDPGLALACVPQPGPGVRVIFVANKADLLAGPPPAPSRAPTVLISAKLRQGLDALEAALLAPYSDLIEPARAGAAVVFDADAASALRALRSAVHSDPCAEALESLRAARER
jgi:tRNA modification GTPase